MKQHTCLNCDTVYTDSFCNKCGQKITHRYTIAHIMHEVVHVFTHADKGIFSFARNLLVKPGIVALDLVQGKRKRYFNLFQYLILVGGIITFLMAKSHFYENVLANNVSAANIEVSTKQAAFQKDVLGFMQKYNNLLMLSLIPVFAFFGWLFTGRKKYNYAENIVLFAAIIAQSTTIGIATALAAFFLKPGTWLSVYIFISFLIGLLCFIIGMRQFYKLRVLKSILLSVLVYGCTYLVQIIIMIITTIVYLASSGLLK